MKKRLEQNIKGFTLVELVVVIAILVALAALLVPRIIGSIDSASESKEMASARTLAGEIATHNAKVLGDDTGTMDTIPKLLPSGAVMEVVKDDMLGPIGRDTEGIISNIEAKGYEISVDSNGDAYIKF